MDYSHCVWLSRGDNLFLLNCCLVDGSEPLELEASLLDLLYLSCPTLDKLGVEGHVVPPLHHVKGVNDEHSGVKGAARVQPVVAGGDPQTADGEVHSRELILVPVESPGVSPADSLENFSEMHVYVGELSREDVQGQKIVVVLLVGSEVVGDDAH